MGNFYEYRRIQRLAEIAQLIDREAVDLSTLKTKITSAKWEGNNLYLMLKAEFEAPEEDCQSCSGVEECKSRFLWLLTEKPHSILIYQKISIQELMDSA